MRPRSSWSSVTITAKAIRPKPDYWSAYIAAVVLPPIGIVWAVGWAIQRRLVPAALLAWASAASWLVQAVLIFSLSG